MSKYNPSNYEFVEPGVTRLAERELSKMSLLELEDQRQKIDLIISEIGMEHNHGGRSHANINADIALYQQLFKYIDKKIAEKKNGKIGGRRTRRNKKSKKSLRRRR